MLTLIQDLGMQYPTETSSKKKKYGLYRCDCGNIVKSQSYRVNGGYTMSCGCLRIEKITKHGLVRNRMYNSWNNMIQRCTNPNHISYKNYGAIGIKVCERWFDFANFVQDMQDTFKSGLSIDRINSLENYEPSNCRWATKTVQARNTKVLQKNNTSGYRGVSLCLKSNVWFSRIRVNGKLVHLGTFKNKNDAAQAFNDYVDKHNLEHTKNTIIKDNQ
ncbi:MAG TPA: hypothetical protein VFM18_22365 [Methanosarcina sp.]|nr:hypothetical protein [Methanosarcina sp.]